ncbi:Poly(U)-specific endoribonuclease homolog [Eumeta japonica]|uniref:Poly(U)-specific endoribonuclease homolog n=1 Tax=Eumeta variegata TaxID=151549 RepID=A0A4C1UNV0_EUMVA|nr:Poly(U)-specific endoribonuclease homolog [Eumeta japonica]
MAYRYLRKHRILRKDKEERTARNDFDVDTDQEPLIEKDKKINAKAGKKKILQDSNDTSTSHVNTDELYQDDEDDHAEDVARDWNRQQNLNTDFLHHEAGSNRPTSKPGLVNPQFPPLGNPSQSSATQNIQGGHVKDLVNQFNNRDSPNGPTLSPNKPLSYKDILQGSSKNQQNTPISPGNQPQTASTVKVTSPVTPPPSTFPAVPTTKPPSFSSVAAGNSKPSSPSLPHSTKLFSTITTPRPSTPVQGTTKAPSSSVASRNPTTNRPTSPVLPSTIVNQSNRNGQNTNSNEPTDVELQNLSEELLRKDTNNAARYVTVNYQAKTTSQDKADKAPSPLLTVSNAAWNIPTIQKFIPLLDNYERDTLVNEYVTPQERNEEIAFMDVIMATNVMRHLMNFLKDKGYVSPDPKLQRDFLKQLWFGLYSRGKGKISSSGFEHVFVSELKNGEVSGLHNWIYFAKEEAANRVNYLGYLKYSELNDKGVVMKLHFNQQGVDKPVDSMFVGTSPELEMALYTLCFVTRADRDCRLKLASQNVDIVTHTFRYRSKNMIAKKLPQDVNPRGVFACNELDLAEVKVYGFDYDYTLAHYKPTLEHLLYNLGREILLEKYKYPPEILKLEYKPNFAVRGLHYDIEKGLLLKLDSFLQIQFGAVYRGLTPVSTDEVLKLYKNRIIPIAYVEGDHKSHKANRAKMVHLADLFSVPEMGLLCNVAEYFIKNHIDYHPEILFLDVKGTVKQLQDLTGWYGHQVLYFGDHPYSDLADVTLEHGWRTGAIINELTHEINTLNTRSFKENANWLQMLTQLIEDHQDYEEPEALEVLGHWMAERDYLRNEIKAVFNPQFGSVFRTYHNPTYFSRRLFRFADIYTSNITNLLKYSLTHTFYPRRGVMPHEYGSYFV